MRTRTLPWPDIISFYEQLANEPGWGIEPMIGLVHFLAHSDYASGLFAYTSHDKLCISRVPDFVIGDCELQVQFHSQSQAFRFTYQQSPANSSTWSRNCQASEWRDVLEHILHRRLEWFHRTNAA